MGGSCNVTRDSASGSVVLREDFDLSNIEQLRRCLEAFDAEHPAVLDMEHVTFCDSTVLNLLALTAKRGVPVAISNPSAFAARVLQLSGLDTMVTTG